MGAIANLTNQESALVGALDSVVIRRVGGCIIGGRTLDVTGFEGQVINAGHVIIKETETETYKPLGVSGDAYVALPAGHEYAGILRGTITVDAPFASILYDGEVNDLCVPYALTDDLRKGLKEAFPSLYFMHD